MTTPIYERPAELLQSLIRFDTTNPPGNEAECIAYIDGLLTEAGFETTLLAMDENRPNLVTRLHGSGDAPALVLQGHVDVVTTENQEWDHPPFEGLNIDGWIWGRGALDMKGDVSTMMCAVIARQGGRRRTCRRHHPDHHGRRRERQRLRRSLPD